jgi:hypothetical protein
MVWMKAESARRVNKSVKASKRREAEETEEEKRGEDVLRIASLA